MKPVLSCALAVLLAAPLFAAAPPASVDDARLTVLFEKLDSDSFTVRHKADKTLRALGKPVLSKLKAERERTKSHEVRFRLDRMIQDLTYDDRVAEWVRLLGHPQPDYRRQAGQALRNAGANVLPILHREMENDLNTPCRANLEKIITELSKPRN